MFYLCVGPCRVGASPVHLPPCSDHPSAIPLGPPAPLGPDTQDGVAAAPREDVRTHLGHMHLRERGEWVTRPLQTALRGRQVTAGLASIPLCSAVTAGGLQGGVSFPSLTFLSDNMGKNG